MCWLMRHDWLGYNQPAKDLHRPAPTQLTGRRATPSATTLSPGGHHRTPVTTRPTVSRHSTLRPVTRRHSCRDRRDRDKTGAGNRSSAAVSSPWFRGVYRVHQNRASAAGAAAKVPRQSSDDSAPVEARAAPEIRVKSGVSSLRRAVRLSHAAAVPESGEQWRWTRADGRFPGQSGVCPPPPPVHHRPQSSAIALHRPPSPATGAGRGPRRRWRQWPWPWAGGHGRPTARGGRYPAIFTAPRCRRHSPAAVTWSACDR